MANENPWKRLNDYAIELMEQSPKFETGREMRFVGGDVPVLKGKGKTMKEKLIELLEQTKYCSVEEQADYLIAAGLTLPKQGHWVIHSSGMGSNANNWAVCSECQVCGNPMWKVCPVCETRMVIENA